MVAIQIAPGRAVAVAIVALLTFSALPFVPVPTAQAQFGAATDIYVEPGRYTFTQGTFPKPTQFVDNGTDFITLSVPVFNVGPEVSNIPAYMWIQGAADRTDCVKVRRGDGTTLPQGQSGSPTMGWANFSINVDVMPPGMWNVSVAVFNATPTGANPNPPIEPEEACTTPMTVASVAGSPCIPPTSGVTCRADLEASNNYLVATFIKDHFLDLKIREIRWCAENEDGTCNSALINSQGEVINMTPPGGEFGDDPVITFFEVVVEHAGGKPHSWTSGINPGGECMCATDGFGYELNVSVAGQYIPGRRNVTSFPTTAERPTSGEGWEGHLARSEDFLINGLAGVYNVTVKVDQTRQLRRHATDTLDDTAHRNDIEVAYRDFVGNFTLADFRTTSANAHDYLDTFIIGGGVTFENRGPAPRCLIQTACTTSETVSITVYLDNETWTDAGGVVHYNSEDKFRKNFTLTPTGNFTTMYTSFQFEASRILTSEDYLPPGRHTLYGYVDAVDSGDGNPCTCMLESNETNNLFSIPIFIKDTTKPVFNGTPKIVISSTAGVNAPALPFYRPHEPFNIYAKIQDDDDALTARANFTLNSNTSVYRVVNLSFVEGTDYFYAHVGQMKFHNFSNLTFNGTEDWTVTVAANDSFGNNVTSAIIPFKLKAWPIHNATGDYVVVEPDVYPHDNFSWNGDFDPKWTIRVEPNMTGLTSRVHKDHQQFNTSNLRLNVTVLATGKVLTSGPDAWSWNTPIQAASNQTNPTPQTGCNPYPPEPGEIGGITLPGESPIECPETNNTFTTTVFRKDDGAAPGIWNYSVLVRDIAGYVRAINGTLLLEDLKPQIHSANLSGTTTVTPPGSLRVQANVSDDNNQITGAYLNLTRFAPGDGRVVNLSLTKRTEASFQSGVTNFLYNETVDIARGSDKAIGLGGTFNVSIHVVDDVGNWVKTSIPGNLTIKDEEAPQLVAFGVTPSVAEIGENVTFWANATDLTNVTMKLEIFKAAGSQELLLDPIFINQSAGGPYWNYTTTLNFSAEAVHSYRITAIDSVNIASSPGTGTFTVRDNLGPKYDIRSPSVVIDGERYGSATPRIEVIVHDVEGVISSSIELKVAGLAVDFETLPAPGNINGYLVSYQVPTSKKFTHRDVVDVNLTARDGSVEELLSYRNFSFVVDDVAPTVRLVSISPSYRDQPAHVLNVSLNSRFTLAAEDVDGMPTQVPTGGIRYRILGGGPGSAETVYATPFRINDAAGVYTGPRLYQIQFWAEDDVGNFNRAFETTTVYVDDTPPALFQFFPQGRSINATFVDDRVGVNRSVVWYRINDQPYVPLPLTEREGSWSTTLPEGVKGDRIRYYLQAWDRLDNTETFGNATSPYASFDVSNHEPKIRIVTPADGSRVSRSFDLTWEASDEDGDALVFTLYYRAPGRTNFVELAKLENSAARRYTVDTARFADGEYTFRIAAGDGGFVKLAETTVTVINSAEAIGVVSVTGEAVPGGTMIVTAVVTKAEATVEARLYLDGELVGAYPMNDEGRDGDATPSDNVYTARVPVEAAGDYTVEIFTQYRENGELKESSIRPDDAVFSAKLTPGYILTEYGAIIALIGLLAAVGIGVAVFVVMRRR